MITPEMQQLVERNTVGFVATVTPDGKPAVSPKGTCVVIDGKTIAFGEIRSPGTMRNIARNPAVEINFLDVLSRKAVRLSGTARHVARGAGEFEALLPRFGAWSALVPRLRGIVVVDVSAARLVTSPVYDIGATEEELRTRWRAHYGS